VISGVIYLFDSRDSFGTFGDGCDDTGRDAKCVVGAALCGSNTQPIQKSFLEYFLELFVYII
tara:strand:- start:84 stop:269 length:186 start_codon:yes stop_codon:yes gene_type:complete